MNEADFVSVFHSLRVLIAIVIAVVGMRSTALAEGQASPDLGATIDFMNRMVLPESRQITWGSPTGNRTAPENKCHLTIISRQLVSSWLDLGDQWFIAVDSDNNEKQFPRYTTVLLGDIDPSSIESRSGGFSSEYVKRFYDEHPIVCKDGTKNPECKMLFQSAFWHGEDDITAVAFKTTDLKRTIERGALKTVLDCEPAEKLDGTCPMAAVPNVTVDRVLFFLNDKDRAERFVTALKHAVNLCGGTGPQFPPTPQAHN